MAEDRAETAELRRDDDHRGDDRDVDQHVLHDRDHGRRAQARRVRVRGENRERDNQRQIADETRRIETERTNHHLNTDELQRNVRHRCDNPRHGDRQREHAAVVARVHEVGCGDVAEFLRDRPQLREHDERERIDQDGVRQREEAGSASAEHKRWNRDERVRRIKIATQQEPRDDRAEATAAEAPFIELSEIGLAPVSGHKAKNRHADKKQDEDEGCGGVHHRGLPGVSLGTSWMGLVFI